MARTKALTALEVKSARPGVHGDGNGLYLRVKPSGSRSWILRVQHDGRRQDIGLGSAELVSLSEAREKAFTLRRIARTGGDAILARDADQCAAQTFAEAVELVHSEFSKGWTEKTSSQFKASMDQHVLPVLGRRRVDTIGAADLIAVLSPIWTAKPQIARKIRHRTLQVLSFAKARGFRSEAAPDPSEIRRGLPKQPRAAGFAAMPYKELPEFYAAQCKLPASPARLAMLFAITTAARSGEVRFSEWSQIDDAEGIWRRPGAIMKAGEDHAVALSKSSLKILQIARSAYGGNGLIFPSRSGSVLTNAAIGKMLKDSGRSETVHGFRSSFRDWAAECMPQMPSAVVEVALSHSVGDAVERAYLRSDFLALRRDLMAAWGQFLECGHA